MKSGRNNIESYLRGLSLDLQHLRKELSAVRESQALLRKISGQLDELMAPLGSGPASPPHVYTVNARDLKPGLATYPLERDVEGSEFAWTYADEPLELAIPISADGRYLVSLKIGSDALQRGFSVTLNQHKLPYSTEITGNTALAAATIGVKDIRCLQLCAAVQKPLIPADIDPQSLDQRLLGVAFYSLTLEKQQDVRKRAMRKPK